MVKDGCVWLVLRGEDSTWITPSSIRWDVEKGFQCQLARTKITGPSEKTRSREFLDGWSGYLSVKQWMKAGLSLWGNISPSLENFILLPSPDLDDLGDLGAEPADRAALTRLLLAKID